MNKNRQGTIFSRERLLRGVSVLACLLGLIVIYATTDWAIRNVIGKLNRAIQEGFVQGAPRFD